MKPCKAKLPDGKPCPNQVDDGQEYCPFHLASQDAGAKNILSFVKGIVLGVVAAGTYKVAIDGVYKAAKFVVRKML